MGTTILNHVIDDARSNLLSVLRMRTMTANGIVVQMTSDELRRLSGADSADEMIHVIHCMRLRVANGEFERAVIAAIKESQQLHRRVRSPLRIHEAEKV